MKKVLWLCLGLLLGMMLTACGSSGSASGMESESEVLASDIIVHVEINPSFDIHVNNDGTIKQMDCLNEDAQTVYAEMDLTGVVYADGLKQLLTAIHKAGFLSEGAKINVEIQQKSFVTYEVSKITDEVLADFDANVASVESEVNNEVVEQKVNVIHGSGTYAIVAAQNNSTWRLGIYFDGDGDPDIQLYLDENQMIIYVYCWEDSDIATEISKQIDITGKNVKDGLLAIFDAGYTLGYISESKPMGFLVWDYGPEPNRLYAQLNSWLVEYMWESQRYYEVAFAMTKEEWSKYCGESVELRKDVDGVFWKHKKRYENGVCMSWEKISTYGDIERAEFSEEGELLGTALYWYTEKADGTINETKWNEQGNRIYHYEFRPNGKVVTEIEIKCNDQGVPTYNYEKSRDGTTRTRWFDENGNLIKEE